MIGSPDGMSGIVSVLMLHNIRTIFFRRFNALNFRALKRLKNPDFRV